MMLNPKHGVIGMLALPYFLLFETLGYVMVALSWFLGLLNVDFFILFMILAVFKVKAFYDFLRRRKAWGRMERAGPREPTVPPGAE